METVVENSQMPIIQLKKTDKIFNIKENITSPLPDGLAQKLPRKGDIEYVSGTTIIDILNKVFNHSWSIEYSDPIIEPFTKGDHSVVTIKARLSVRMIDPETGEPITVVREGYGSDTLNPKNPNGTEMVTKSASTDALKRAAYTFGIAGELKRKHNPVSISYFNSLNSDWDDYTYMMYSKEWAIIRDVMTTYHMNYNIIRAIMKHYSGGNEFEVTPNNIKDFVKYLKSLYPGSSTTTDIKAS